MSIRRNAFKWCPRVHIVIEWFADLVFLVTRLFADKDDDTCSAFTEYRLSRVPKQRTGLTFCRFFAKFTQIVGRRDGSSLP
jgi:hypothetical protein